MTTKHLLIAMLLSVHYLTGMTEDKPVITLSADNITHLWDQSSLADYLTNEDALPLIHTSKNLAIFFTKQRKAVIERFETKIAPKYNPKIASERAKENALISYETIDINSTIFPRFFRPNAAPYCIGIVNEWQKKNDTYKSGDDYLAKLTFLDDDTLTITKEDAPAGVIDSGRYWRCSSTKIRDSEGSVRKITLFNADHESYVIEMPSAYQENFYKSEITYSKDDTSFIASHSIALKDSSYQRFHIYRSCLYQSHDYYYLQINNNTYSKTCKTYTTDIWGQVKPFNESRSLPKLLTFLINNGAKTEIPKPEIDEAGWAHTDVLFNLPFDNPLWPVGIQPVLELYYSDQKHTLTTEQQIQIYVLEQWAGIDESSPQKITWSYPRPLPDRHQQAKDLCKYIIDPSVNDNFSVPYITARAMHWLDNQAEGLAQKEYDKLPASTKLWRFPNRYISEKIYITLGAFLIRFMPSMESIRFG